MAEHRFPENAPPWLFEGTRPLDHPRTTMAIEAVGGFHDAWLRVERITATRLRLSLHDPYFPSAEEYGLFGIDGAEIVLALQPGEQPPDFADGSDFEVYELDPDLRQGILRLTIYDPRTGDVVFHDGGLRMIPAESFFSWTFQGVPQAFAREPPHPLER